MAPHESIVFADPGIWLVALDMKSSGKYLNIVGAYVSQWEPVKKYLSTLGVFLCYIKKSRSVTVVGLEMAARGRLKQQVCYIHIYYAEIYFIMGAMTQ